MQIKDGIKAGICNAMRCKEPAAHTVAGAAWGRESVELCTRHYGQAVAAGMAGEAPARPSPPALPEAEAEAAAGEALAIVTEARAFEITTQEEIDFAGEVLREIKAKAADLDKREKAITAPMNAALKAARDLFRPAKTHLAEAESVLKSAIARFVEATEARHVASMAAASAAHAAGDLDGAAVALANVATLEGVEGVRASQVWEFEITDPDTLPREYLTPDVVAIRGYMRRIVASGETPEIPGVRFYRATRIAASAAR